MRVALGLGAVQLAVTLGWMGYTYFQPRILAENSLERFDSLLAGYIAAGGTMLGPLAGGLADLTLRRQAVASRSSSLVACWRASSSSPLRSRSVPLLQARSARPSRF